jgi:hypothetical protein
MRDRARRAQRQRNRKGGHDGSGRAIRKRTPVAIGRRALALQQPIEGE